MRETEAYFDNNNQKIGDVVALTGTYTQHTEHFIVTGILPIERGYRYSLREVSLTERIKLFLLKVFASYVQTGESK